MLQLLLHVDICDKISINKVRLLTGFFCSFPGHQHCR